MFTTDLVVDAIAADEVTIMMMLACQSKSAILLSSQYNATHGEWDERNGRVGLEWDHWGGRQWHLGADSDTRPLQHHQERPTINRTFIC